MDLGGTVWLPMCMKRKRASNHSGMSAAIAVACPAATALRICLVAWMKRAVLRA